ncbi:class I SAM-dependent methyltransferase [Flagellimonas meridianipacifica]|uniref:Ubiquinone/menaquinone biosynthesis C-methylase UbiE n=1 Tax=Flagellimonas meridianipacifica TaxID=1080225 RepID=A0A2T0MAX1_9FLAO|nr:class I SAM-dependent methyltransferase [Allomuricauda pacifica]PRX54643.1 ubiquinone/menaquinone biosynthesis C-methylase UbiE [Allomuricauda pacifica]
MIKAMAFDEYVDQYEVWYEKHQEVYLSEIEALREQFQKLPQNIRGIEVGLGTGRFSEPLGIKEGLEPSEAMTERAVKRGIEVIHGFAERLPYADLTFNFVLFVTICHLDNIRLALSQAHRVLKDDGSIIIGFLDKTQSIAKQYEEKRQRSTFYKNARFFSPERIEKLLLESGFKDLEFNQTLFGNLDEIKEIQLPKPGYGKGSFVVVKATKK